MATKNDEPKYSSGIVVVILISACFILISGISFKWGRVFKWGDPDYIVDQELLGTYGDFVGGVLGTILTIISVLLLIMTFRHQQKVTSNNEEESKTQRFNNLFFELLHLYQSEVNELCGQRERIIKIEKDDKTERKRVHTEEASYNNKDFFDEEKLYVQRMYRNISYEESRRRVVRYYMLFYTEYRSKIAAYYRTLYRIYELIDKTKLIENDEKKRYAKIIRAQLTESELFFIRYNARTMHGSPFVEYINKYNILKHLPVFELLEFKHWWKYMSKIDQEGINIIYFGILKTLKTIFKDINNNSNVEVGIFPDDISKYQFKIISRKRSYIELQLVINLDSQYFTSEYRGLEKLQYADIQQLLECFIKEIFIHSNFGTFNNENDLEVSSIPIVTENNKTIIRSYIKNVKFKEIKLLAHQKV